MTAMEWTGIHLLIQRAKAGDQNAWTALHRLSWPLLVSAAGELLGDNWEQQSVRDVVQETWLKVVAGLDGFRGGGGDEDTGPMWRAFLLTVARRAAANVERAATADKRTPPGRLLRIHDLRPADESQRPAFDVVDPGPTPSRAARTAEQETKIREALRELEPDERLVIEMTFFSGMSYKDIAAQTPLTVDEVRCRLHKALERLGRKLGGLA